MSTLFTVGVAALVIYSVIDMLRSEFAKSGYMVLTKLRPIHFLAALVSITSVVTISLVLYTVPFLQWGWWASLGGEGSIITASNSNATSVWSTVLSLGVLSFVIIALPVFAWFEENVFRKNSQNFSLKQLITSNVAFGLIHLIMGIPIAIALALIAAGFIFQRVYLYAYKKQAHLGERAATQHALEQASAVHLAHNIVVLTFAFVSIAVGLS